MTKTVWFLCLGLTAGVLMVGWVCAGVLVAPEQAQPESQSQQQGKLYPLPEVFQWLSPLAEWTVPVAISGEELANPSLLPVVDGGVAGLRSSSFRPGFGLTGPVTPRPGPARPPIPEPATGTLAVGVGCLAAGFLRRWFGRRQRS